MTFFITDPKILTMAFLGGIIPSLLWLWFWLKEEEDPEPKGLLALVFILGMTATIAVLPIEKYIMEHVASTNAQIILWAGAEEILKYLAVFTVLYKSSKVTEPIDWPIFLITAALGFAAMENTLYLIKPLSGSENVLSLLYATSLGQLRFLGANLLHTVSSGTIGIAMGLSFFMGKTYKKWFLGIGLVVAIALHSTFNFFIISNSGTDFMKAFAFLWVVTIIVILIFEKIRRMSEKIIN